MKSGLTTAPKSCAPSSHNSPSPLLKKQKLFIRHDSKMTSLILKNENATFLEILSRAESVPGLSTFVLEDVAIQGDEDGMLALSRFFRGNDSLESVTFRNVDTSGAECDLSTLISTLFVSTYNLNMLVIEHSDFKTASLSAMVYSRYIKTLKLPNNDFSDEDAVAIADFLTKSKSIQDVDLSNNALSDLGCHAIADAVKRNTAIDSVNIEGNGQITLEVRTSLEAKLKSAKAA